MSRFTIEQIPSPLSGHLPREARLVWPQQGMTSQVAIATGKSGAVVFKRCVERVYLPWLKREHSVLKALEGLGLPVPSVLDYAELECASGSPEAWLVMSHVVGTSLWRTLLEARESDRQELMYRLGRMLHRLHSTPVPPGLEQHPDWTTRKLLQAQENLSWCDGTEEILRALHKTRLPAVMESLIHGDLALDNVLVDECGNLSLIDWSGGDSGDYRSDIALALQTEPELTLGEGEYRAFYEGYGAQPLDAETRRWFVMLYEFF